MIKIELVFETPEAAIAALGRMFSAVPTRTIQEAAAAAVPVPLRAPTRAAEPVASEPEHTPEPEVVPYSALSGAVIEFLGANPSEKPAVLAIAAKYGAKTFVELKPDDRGVDRTACYHDVVAYVAAHA